MGTHVVYCSACDRQVRVVYPEAPQVGGAGGPEVDPAGVCLDYCSSDCTGTMCALFDLPPAQMLVKLRERGMIPEA
jgi:hypothetical protein